MSNMLPSPDKLNNEEYGKYALSNLAAKRAKQIKEGAPPLVAVDSMHPLTIALAEIAAGKIKPIMQAVEEPSMIETGDFERISEEPLPAELGMLLPALDESTDAALIETLGIDEEHDIEADHEGEVADVLSLSDLVSEEDDVAEEAPAVGEDDTLSLSDIAEQETSLEGEDSEE